MSLPSRAGTACRAHEPCRRAAGTRLPGGEAAPLVSILPRSPADNYTQIKNVSKSNFFSLTSLGRDVRPGADREEGAKLAPRRLVPRGGNRVLHPIALRPRAHGGVPVGHAPPSPSSSSSSTAQSCWTLLEPGLFPPWWHLAGFKEQPRKKVPVQRARMMLQVHSLSMITGF